VGTDSRLRYKIALLLDNLSGGGAEQVILNLAGYFADQAYSVDVLVCNMDGALRDKVPPHVNLVQLDAEPAIRGMVACFHANPRGIWDILRATANNRGLPKPFRHVRSVACYLRRNKPNILLAGLPKANVNAMISRVLAGVDTRVVLTVQIHLSAQDSIVVGRRPGRVRPLRPMMQRYYHMADAVVAASQGVAEDAARYLKLPLAKVTTIHNPVITAEVARLSQEVSAHPWLQQHDVPVFIGIGRFVAQKDFPLLVRAFAELRARRPARLIILGGDLTSREQAENKQKLHDLAHELAVEKDIDTPGYQQNPYAFLRGAAVFVLSSRFEGFGNVVVEALYCGCKVVSTDCPSGPAEILANGEFGQLVPVGDQQALVAAMDTALDAPTAGDAQRARADEFTVNQVAAQYLLLFDSLLP
jgi:glycosyltransferase involved in cell wall biosynthesis